MAISVVGTTTPVSTVSAATVAWPSGHLSGDFAVLIAASRDGQPVTPPSGWTAFTNLPKNNVDAGAGTGNGTNLAAWYKFASSSSEASVTLADPGAYTLASMMVFRGVDSTTPVLNGATISTYGGSTTYAIPGTSTTHTVSPSTNSLLNLFIASRGDKGSGAGAWGSGNTVTSVGDSGGATVAFEIAYDAGSYEGTLLAAYDSAVTAGGSYTPVLTFNGTGTRSNTVGAMVTLQGPSSSPIAAMGGFSVDGSATLKGTAAAASSDAISFALSATLLGAGALLSAGSFAFDGSATLGGSAPLTATISSAFDGSANLSGIGALGHTGSIVFDGTATGIISSGTASFGGFTFGGTAALTGTGALAATIPAAFSDNLVISATANAQHAGGFTFGGTATGSADAWLQATIPSTFSATGTLLGAGALASTGSTTFGGTAGLQGAGALAHSGGFTFDGTASGLAGAFMFSTGPLVTFSHSATLSAKGALASTGTTTIFTHSATLAGTAGMSSTGTVVFGGTANGTRVGFMSSTGPITFAGSASIRSIPNPIYATTWKNKWLAVYLARQALLDKIAYVADATLESHATSITTLTAAVAGKASVTAVESLEARVSATEAIYGVNLLLNPGLAIDGKGWGAVFWNEASDPNWVVARDDLGTSYQVAGTHNFGFHNTGTPAASKNFMAGGDYLAVEPGFDYIFSGLLAAANVSICDLRLFFFDDTFTYLSEDSTAAVGAGFTGGTNIANWQQRFLKTTPPAGAKWMRLGLRVFTSGAANPRAHLMRAMIERAAADMTTPSTWNWGPVTAWAKWDVSFDVNGYISGISLASDGRSTAFNVAADAFGIRAPAGTEALTWENGVITAFKGSNSLKLGPGFGYNNTGSKRLILWYGADGSTDTRTYANAKIAIATSGAPKLGGIQTNFGSGWATGGAVSTYGATAGTPATATISVASGTFYIDGDTVAYSASSVGVTGTNGTTVTYYLYYLDAERAGGAQTLYASTDPQVTYTDGDKLLIASIAVTFPTSGSGSGGGGGGWCPSVDAWVYRRTAEGVCEWARAGDVQVGDFLLLRSMRWGRVSFSERRWSARVCIHGGDGGSLTCSDTAPIGCYPGGTVAAVDAFDHTADCLVAGRAGGNYIDQVTDEGDGWVQHLTVENDYFWCGDTKDFLFAHHNRKPGIDP